MSISPITNGNTSYPGAQPSKSNDATYQQQQKRPAASANTINTFAHKEKFELSIADEAVIRAVEKANKALAGVGTEFHYSVHEKTGEILVKVLNKDTHEVIREIPSEKILDLVAKLQEICGVIVDEKR